MFHGAYGAIQLNEAASPWSERRVPRLSSSRESEALSNDLASFSPRFCRGRRPQAAAGTCKKWVLVDVDLAGIEFGLDLAGGLDHVLHLAVRDLAGQELEAAVR